MSALVKRGMAVILACAVVSAHATDLFDAWHAAQDHAPDAQVALAARAVGAAQRDEAGTVWRPSVAVSASAGLSNNDTSISGAQFAAPGFGQVNGANFRTSVNGGTATRWSVHARQPLLNRVRRIEGRQLELGGDMADLAYALAQQRLMLQTAQQYFDVVRAEEQLRVLRREQRSVEYALTEMRDRFTAGDIPITDTHEASARAEAIRAEVMGAESELEFKRAVLSDAMGEPLAAGALPRFESDPGPFPLEPVDYWLGEARTQSPLLRMQELGVQSARIEADKLSSAAAPTIDLVAQLSRERVSGSGDYGVAANGAGVGMIGVQVTIPLYTGGNRSARQTTAMRGADKAAAEVARSRDALELQARHAWLSLHTAQARLRALAEALHASTARLDATRLGRQVGDRTTLDLLSAENDTAHAELALSEGRIAVVLDRLQLAEVAGQLDDGLLRSINSQLREAGKD